MESTSSKLFYLRVIHKNDIKKKKKKKKKKKQYNRKYCMSKQTFPFIL